MKTKISKTINIIFMILSTIWFGTFVVLNLTHADITNSDLAQTGIYSRAIWEAGTLRPESFIVWSESGIFSLGLIGAPVYGLTKSIWLAQTIPPIIVSILILIAVIYLLKGLNIHKNSIILFLLLMLSFPINTYVQSMTFLFYAAYSQVVLTMFWILGDYVRIMDGKLKHERIHIYLQFVIAFMQGLNSSRGVLMVYAPLFLLQVVRCMIEFLKEKEVNNKNLKLFWYCFICLTISYGATYLPWSVRARTELHLQGTLQHFLVKIIPSLLIWIGVNNNPNWFLKMIIIIVFAIAVFVLVQCLVNANINDKISVVNIFFWFSLGITIGILTFGKMEPAGRYFLPIMYAAYCSLIWLLNNRKISLPPHFISVKLDSYPLLVYKSV